jgi:L-threonylcarbamoyladenylate synthase
VTEILGRTDRDILRAADILRAGDLVAFGTETVYGLGADATNALAVAAVFEAKGRPRFNPLICHYATAESAFADVVASPLAEQLADTFWPGPLTMVLPRRDSAPVSLLAAAGLETLAVRVPAHPVAQRLITALGRPVAAPSANRSGRISPTSVAHVLAGLEGRIAAVIDSGDCRVGVESTVVDLSGPEPILLRPGGVSFESLQASVASLQRRNAAAAAIINAPGMLASHYAPKLPLRINVTEARGDEALLAFGPPLPGAGVMFQLSASQNLNEACAKLFEGLHWLDAQAAALGLGGIAAMPVPAHGLGLAINDRLQRASA